MCLPEDILVGFRVLRTDDPPCRCFAYRPLAVIATRNRSFDAHQLAVFGPRGLEEHLVLWRSQLSTKLVFVALNADHLAVAAPRAEERPQETAAATAAPGC
eukprot:4057496-Prymnesium_polylepis.1